MRGECRAQPIHAGVVRISQERDLVRLRGSARLVDLDPGSPLPQQRLDVWPDQIARNVEDELAARVGAVVAAGRRGDGGAISGQVILVERPHGQRVGAGHRHLDRCPCRAAEQPVLALVVGSAQADRTGHGRFRVVLIVEAAHAAPGRETVGVGYRPGVHLAALLLSVVHHVQPGGLEEPQPVAAGPVLDLVPLRVGQGRRAQQVQQPFVAVDPQPHPPTSG